MSDDCVFCKIARGELETELIRDTELAVAFEDLHPQAPVHCLIVPKEHVPTLNDLQAYQGPLIGHLLELAREIAAERGIAESGYRTVFNCNAAGGQTVFHIHLHLLGGRNLGWPPG